MSGPKHRPTPPVRSIPTRPVPRAAVEALVARLRASGAVVAPVMGAP